MAADITPRDGDTAARPLLDEAGAALKTIDAHVPATFAAQLYGQIGRAHV